MFFFIFLRFDSIKLIVTMLQPKPQTKPSHLTLTQSLLQQYSAREQQLNRTIRDLQWRNRELGSALEGQQPAKHQFQRFRHLLSIKEQLILAQQKEIEQLKNSLLKITHKIPPQIAKSRAAPHAIDINELSKIDSLCQSDSGERECGFETKRKICLKKGKETKNSIIFRGDKGRKGKGLSDEGHQLEVARLRSQVGKLQAMIEGLQLQLKMADIQMGHLSRDCQVTSKRERKLHQTLMRLLGEQQMKRGQESSLGQKCEMLERYIDQLTDRMEKMDQTVQLQPPPIRTLQHAPPPITPHFSNAAAFIFPTARKTPTKLQSPPQDEIFEACCEQDLPE